MQPCQMFIFSRRLMIMAYVSDPSFCNSFIHDSPAGSVTGDPERSNVTLKLLGSRTGHSALWPLRPEIRQAILSRHWPRLNQRKSRALVYVWESYADNYDHLINKSSLGWNEMGCVHVWVSAWESLCVSHQRWRCCRGRRIWPKRYVFFSDPGLAGVQFCHMFTCPFRLNQWAQIKLCRGVRQQDILTMLRVEAHISSKGLIQIKWSDLWCICSNRARISES